MVVIVWQLVLPVPITTNVVSSSLAQCEVYWIQHYAIQFVTGLW